MSADVRYVVPIGLLLLVGCKSEEPGAIVRGKITYKGAPFGEGSVVFYADGSGQTSYGNLQPDGRFQLLNPRKTVRIEPGKYVAVILAGTDQIAQLREDPLHPVEPAVPLKFSSVTTSPLKYDVVVGENEFDINLDNL